MRVFQQLDSNNKGYLTKQDVAAGLDLIQPQGSAAAAAPGQQNKPSRTGSGPPGGGGGSATTVSTDPADTNQDGKVSLQEEIAYIIKQYTMGDSTGQSSSATYI